MSGLRRVNPIASRGDSGFDSPVIRRELLIHRKHHEGMGSSPFWQKTRKLVTQLLLIPRSDGLCRIVPSLGQFLSLG
jgi:hypothetical protein